MLKRRNICKWLMFIICVSLFLCGSASANDNEFNDSKSNKISEPSIKEFENDPSFIAYRGTLPETIDQKWENSIVNCWFNLTQIGPSYSEFDNSIKNVASNNEMLIIELGSAYKEEVNDSRIDEIYQKIEDYCEQQEGIDEIPVVFMWAHDEENLPLPDYGPQIFDEVKTESGFITTRGTMPVITDANKKVEWEETAGNCIHSFRDDLQPYMKSSDGSLTGYGYNYRGYIFVAFDPKSLENVNDSIIDEIYLIIDNHCKQEGVSEVPVVFEWRGEAIVNLAPAVELDVNESGDTNFSDNKETIAGNEKTNQTPGFTSITAILLLLSLLVFKRSA
ncbi:hypothetical protein MSBRW_3424 [Methanosarcina barkeri str. Wiesmoor]|uniref:Uncharacterized protein n=3 Tax=Methanosarcina barkeri TaxID=2208 RepID=A0A0E3QNE7_METBA|nr:hypothetical protein MSBRW_3424 [Methanosarcina barkeri str. Wiesmoor]